MWFLLLLLGGGIGSLILWWKIKGKINTFYARLTNPGKTDEEIMRSKFEDIKNAESQEEVDSILDSINLL